DMLRAAVKEGSELGLKVNQIMTSGGLVSDDIIIALVKERISHRDCANGFLFDGFPRTLPQADAMKEASVKLDHVLEIAVDDEEIGERVAGRRVHRVAGRVYHIEYNPPNEVGKDDVTGEELIQRDADRESAVRNRLSVYHEQTGPLVEYYRQWAHQEPAIAP